MGGSSTSNVASRIKHTYHIGEWGNPYEGGGQPGKGVVTYGISPNRVRPMAGVFPKGFFNMVRRVRNQFLYVVPPFIVAYSAMQWAIERNEYLNSKAGRAEFAEEE
ncbi:UcrQ-domain-containing protein [Westerdykella ornata]|uniref:Cytochrome b-c1 complex subunit 8 n=1 Tax=Westerdykella ornata TaxID=318751 RepID=A0A6A6JEM8_WESOR|nr:UcrQ-domain-containing protein [Westerdykella ornata]KAF2273629.1 UcrQ-domain-containing protein [Westerdykella ornata]